MDAKASEIFFLFCRIRRANDPGEFSILQKRLWIYIKNEGVYTVHIKIYAQDRFFGPLQQVQIMCTLV